MYNCFNGGSMKLIVGLGNPGREYEKTRHNIGFMVVDALLDHLGIKLDQRKFKAHFVKTKIANHDVIIAKPLTYMNLSGQAIGELAQYFNIDNQDILIIYDDFDLPLGKLRLRTKGNGGSHNGMKSVVSHLNSSSINRLRIGIDKNPMIQQKDYVLGKFSKEERIILKQTLTRCTEALIDYPQMNFVDLMTKYNTGKNE